MAFLDEPATSLPCVECIRRATEIRGAVDDTYPMVMDCHFSGTSKKCVKCQEEGSRCEPVSCIILMGETAFPLTGQMYLT